MVMRYRTAARASFLAMAAADPLGFGMAEAQIRTETSSSGEMYTYEDTSEVLLGSVLYIEQFQTEINGETGSIPLMEGMRYFTPFSAAEIQQAVSAQLPDNMEYMVDGVPIMIRKWAPPELIDSMYETIDSYTAEDPYSTVRSIVTKQVTSGDAPNNIVPTGTRLECFSYGTNGATNFAPFDGFFADCMESGEEVEVAPGTINTNTHTTTVYAEGTRYVEIYDEGYYNTHAIRPLETESTSSGTLTTTNTSTTTRRTDSHETRLLGTVGETTLFDAKHAGAFTDAAVQEAVGDLSKPRGYAIGGAPVVVTWAAPVRIGGSEEILSSSTETETSTRRYETVTVTTTFGEGAREQEPALASAFAVTPFEATLGEQVLIGDRGACTTAGTSGTTNGEAPTGAFAACEGGVVYTLSVGETNTNTHTSQVTETLTTTVTTETRLNRATYRLAGTPHAIGQVHAALRDVLYGSDFGRRHVDAIAMALPRDGDRKFGLWALGRTGRDKSRSDAAGPGNRRTTHGASGGLAVRLSEAARIGFAIDYGKTDITLPGLTERGEARLTELGLGADLTPGGWRVRLAARHGWGSIDTVRGTPLTGGMSRAGYRASISSALAEAGPEFSTGNAVIQPFAAIEWTRARLGGFAETGGIALRGDGDSATRLAVSIGGRGQMQWRSGDGSAFRLWATARGTKVADGRARGRGVAFVDDPGTPLRVTSAREGSTAAIGQIGASYHMASGIGLHLGADGAAGGGDRSWRATGGISIAF